MRDESEEMDRERGLEGTRNDKELWRGRRTREGARERRMETEKRRRGGMRVVKAKGREEIKREK